MNSIKPSRDFYQCTLLSGPSLTDFSGKGGNPHGSLSPQEKQLVEKIYQQQMR